MLSSTPSCVINENSIRPHIKPIMNSPVSYMGENLINAQIREARVKSRVLATMSDHTGAESTNPNDLIFTEPIVI